MKNVKCPTCGEITYSNRLVCIRCGAQLPLLPVMGEHGMGVEMNLYREPPRLAVKNFDEVHDQPMVQRVSAQEPQEQQPARKRKKQR
jgi:ribosomal protein L32